MIVIKFGGSRIRPNEEYDESFIDYIVKLVSSHDDKFLIICGGGWLARDLQQKRLSELHNFFGEDGDLVEQGQDLLGIKATRLNAEYVVKRLQEKGIDVNPKILVDPNRAIDSGNKVTIAGGWKPGWSTDYVAMKYAQKLGAAKVIKVSNFEYVKKISPLKLAKMAKEDQKEALAKAEAIHSISWDDMFALVGVDWIPGLSTPLDPMAAKLGVKNKDVKLFIVLESEIENVLSGKKVNGTVVGLK